MQRRQPPRDEAEVMYNNRTLRYWRLSTDYSRFHPDDYDIMGGENGQNNNVVCNGAASSGDEGDGDTTDDDQVYEVVNGG